jgi:lipopolysaccharide transport system ATP-binding protein
MPSIQVERVVVEFTVDAVSLNSLRSFLYRRKAQKQPTARIVRALNDVSFSVGSGERLGVIGPNGAGKTTLLKALAGIYTPQQGIVTVNGHVCPLFEFATGFEMNGSGWDNIRTRSLLLGMAPREIEAKIDEIGEFSQLGQFLDIPVRCYSSGMLLRLAFATSTAVDPQILLLDEVMAAGDEAFIERARRRMNGMMERADIVIFASHSLTLLPTFCSRTIWIDRGRILMDGPTEDVIGHYRQAVAASLAR